jgi:hypothetical protein
MSKTKTKRKKYNIKAIQKEPTRIKIVDNFSGRKYIPNRPITKEVAKIRNIDV